MNFFDVEVTDIVILTEAGKLKIKNQLEDKLHSLTNSIISAPDFKLSGLSFDNVKFELHSKCNGYTVKDQPEDKIADLVILRDKDLKTPAGYLVQPTLSIVLDFNETIDKGALTRIGKDFVNDITSFKIYKNSDQTGEYKREVVTLEFDETDSDTNDSPVVIFTSDCQIILDRDDIDFLF